MSGSFAKSLNNSEVSREQIRESDRISMRSICGLLMYTILNLLASLCFKECGTDAGHTWSYFFIGNIFGPLSLIFLMWVYAGMNANLAAALSMGVGAISVQIAFWLVYDVRLTPLQWTGIALAVMGGIITVSGKPPPHTMDAHGTGRNGGMEQ